MISGKIDKIYLSLIYHEELDIGFACRRPLTFEEVKVHVNEACADYDKNNGFVKHLIDKNKMPSLNIKQDQKQVLNIIFTIKHLNINKKTLGIMRII